MGDSYKRLLRLVHDGGCLRATVGPSGKSLSRGDHAEASAMALSMMDTGSRQMTDPPHGQKQPQQESIQTCQVGDATGFQGRASALLVVARSLLPACAAHTRGCEHDQQADRRSATRLAHPADANRYSHWSQLALPATR